MSVTSALPNVSGRLGSRYMTITPPERRITCRTAQKRSDFEGAFERLYERYLEAGLCLPSDLRRRAMPFHFRKESQVFVACDPDHGRVCGTISLIRDGHHGIPCDELFPREIDRERSRNDIAELSSLAIVSDSRVSRSSVFAEITSLAIHFARCRSVARVVGAVHPRHARFYCKKMGFEQLSGEIEHHGVLGKSAVLIAVSLDAWDRVASDWRDIYFGDRFDDTQLRPRSLTVEDHTWIYDTSFPPQPEDCAGRCNLNICI